MGYNFLWVKAAVLVLLHHTVHAGPSRRLENWSLSEHIKEPYYDRSGIVRLFACRLAMGFYAHSPMDLRSLGIHVFWDTAFGIHFFGRTGLCAFGIHDLIGTRFFDWDMNFVLGGLA